jgi:hypothetical protein
MPIPLEDFEFASEVRFFPSHSFALAASYAHALSGARTHSCSFRDVRGREGAGGSLPTPSGRSRFSFVRCFSNAPCSCVRVHLYQSPAASVEVPLSFIPPPSPPRVQDSLPANYQVAFFRDPTYVHRCVQFVHRNRSCSLPNVRIRTRGTTRTCACRALRTIRTAAGVRRTKN